MKFTPDSLFGKLLSNFTDHKKHNQKIKSLPLKVIRSSERLSKTYQGGCDVVVTQGKILPSLRDRAARSSYCACAITGYAPRICRLAKSCSSNGSVKVVWNGSDTLNLSKFRNLNSCLWSKDALLRSLAGLPLSNQTYC